MWSSDGAPFAHPVSCSSLALCLCNTFSHFRKRAKLEKVLTSTQKKTRVCNVGHVLESSVGKSVVFTE